MKKSVNIDIEPKEVAKLLHQMDTMQIAEVMVEWNRLIKEEFQKKPNFWTDLGSCLMWVASHTDENPDLHDCIRAMYASSISTLGICDFDQVYKP